VILLLDHKAIGAQLKDDIINSNANTANKYEFEGCDTIDDHIERLTYMLEYFKIAKELGFTCYSVQGWRYWEHPNYEPKEE